MHVGQFPRQGFTASHYPPTCSCLYQAGGGEDAILGAEPQSPMPRMKLQTRQNRWETLTWLFVIAVMH